MKTSDILKLDCVTPSVDGVAKDVAGVFCCDLLSVAMARAYSLPRSSVSSTTPDAIVSAKRACSAESFSTSSSATSFFRSP